VLDLYGKQSCFNYAETRAPKKFSRLVLEDFSSVDNGKNNYQNATKKHLPKDGLSSHTGKETDHKTEYENSLKKCAERKMESIHGNFVIASTAKKSRLFDVPSLRLPRRFAPRNDRCSQIMEHHSPENEYNRHRQEIYNPKTTDADVQIEIERFPYITAFPLQILQR